MFGVDTGAIHLLYFIKPVTQLFETPFQSEGGVQKIYMQVRDCRAHLCEHEPSSLSSSSSP